MADRNTSWDSLINLATTRGEDDLRKMYIKMRDEGVDKKYIESMGGVPLSGGFTFSPTDGTISMSKQGEQGYDYKYDPYAKTTQYGDQTYSGLYDPNVLSSITDQDWQSSLDTNRGDFDKRLSSFEGNLDLGYLQDLTKFGGAFTDSVSLDDSHYGDKYGEGFKELEDQYMNKTMESAYEAALGRMDAAPTTIKDLYNTDFTDFYKNQQPKTNDYNLEAIMNNPNMSDAVKQHYISQAKQGGQDVSSFGTPEPAPSSRPVYDRNDPSTWPENQASSKPTDPLEIAYDNQQQAANAPDTPGVQVDQQQPNLTDYAEAALPGAPAQVEQSQGGNPWSEDFEKDFMAQLQGYGDTLNSYLGSATAAPSGPKFSLQEYSRSSAMNANTPTNSPIMQDGMGGVKPNQSSTGKAGQKKSSWS